MKGLIIKDLMCLRKQRVTYLYIVAVVLTVSVMFVLSEKFGNIALFHNEFIGNGMTEIDVKNTATIALLLFMILPIAMVGDVTAIFTADGNAGFANVSASLPVSIEKRVLAKYITVLAFFGIGVSTDLIIAAVVSMITDIVSFIDFFEVIIMAASALFIYGSLVCVYMFLLGYGKENYAQVGSILSIVVALVLFNFEKVKMYIISLFIDEIEVVDVNPIETIFEFLKAKSLITFIAAVIVGLLSYGISVLIAKRKRGIV